LPEGDPIDTSPDPRKSAARTRLTAIILIATGLGTALAFATLAWVVQQRDVLSAAAFAIIPLAIGIGMLIDYRMQSRALEAAQSEKSLDRLSV
jgi:predicted RND superfamily exporter protein